MNTASLTRTFYFFGWLNFFILGTDAQRGGGYDHYGGGGGGTRLGGRGGGAQAPPPPSHGGGYAFSNANPSSSPHHYSWSAWDSSDIVPSSDTQSYPDIDDIWTYCLLLGGGYSCFLNQCPYEKPSHYKRFEAVLFGKFEGVDGIDLTCGIPANEGDTFEFLNSADEQLTGDALPFSVETDGTGSINISPDVAEEDDLFTIVTCYEKVLKVTTCAYVQSNITLGLGSKRHNLLDDATNGDKAFLMQCSGKTNLDEFAYPKLIDHPACYCVADLSAAAKTEIDLELELVAPSSMPSGACDGEVEKAGEQTLFYQGHELTDMMGLPYDRQTSQVSVDGDAQCWTHLVTIEKGSTCAFKWKFTANCEASCDYSLLHNFEARDTNNDVVATSNGVFYTDTTTGGPLSRPLCECEARSKVEMDTFVADIVEIDPCDGLQVCNW